MTSMSGNNISVSLQNEMWGRGTGGPRTVHGFDPPPRMVEIASEGSAAARPRGGETAKMLRLRGARHGVPRTIAAAGLAALAVGVTAPTVAPADTQVAPYQDASQPISVRVDDLLS